MEVAGRATAKSSSQHTTIFNSISSRRVIHAQQDTEAPFTPNIGKGTLEKQDLSWNKLILCLFSFLLISKNWALIEYFLESIYWETIT